MRHDALRPATARQTSVRTTSQRRPLTLTSNRLEGGPADRNRGYRGCLSPFGEKRRSNRLALGTERSRSHLEAPGTAVKWRLGELLVVPPIRRTPACAQLPRPRQRHLDRCLTRPLKGAAPIVIQWIRHTHPVRPASRRSVRPGQRIAGRQCVAAGWAGGGGDGERWPGREPHRSRTPHLPGATWHGSLITAKTPRRLGASSLFDDDRSIGVVRFGRHRVEVGPRPDLGGASRPGKAAVPADAVQGLGHLSPSGNDRQVPGPFSDDGP